MCTQAGVSGGDCVQKELAAGLWPLQPLPSPTLGADDQFRPSPHCWHASGKLCSKWEEFLSSSLVLTSLQRSSATVTMLPGSTHLLYPKDQRVILKARSLVSSLSVTGEPVRPANSQAPAQTYRMSTSGDGPALDRYVNDPPPGDSENQRPIVILAE